MNSILILGFLLGMRHALEADHIAAVATLATRGVSVRHALFHGSVWGMGHTAALFLACSLVLFLDTVVPEHLARLLEGLVGLMLILLGADVIQRMLRKHVHFHTHEHHDGTVHFHAHAHAGETHPEASAHEHDHPASFPLRALYVGLMHGLAGSAALILLTLGTVASPLTGLIYVGLFGLGSIAGMALLSLAISLPLRGARRFTWLYNGLQTTIGTASITIGGLLVYQYGNTLLF